MTKQHSRLSKLLFAASAGVALVSMPAQAGKVDEVKKIIKEKCSKDLSDSEVTDAVVKAYDCTPDSDVSVAGCTIKCLKGGSGSVVGGK
jgi:hypothetical protein